jgi:hypothetical protein
MTHAEYIKKRAAYVRRLEAALAPFAVYAERLGKLSGTVPVQVAPAGGPESNITVQHCRDARAVLGAN